MSESIHFKPHSEKQERLIFSDSALTVAITGTQFGKSQGGTLWMQRQMFTFTDPRDNFIIGAPTYKILQQSVIPYFLFHLQPFGQYSKSDSVFDLKHGGTVYFRTETDPDSIVGIPNVRAGWLDEAGKLRRYFWENYMARAASRGARTLLTTSPYSLNWIYHDIVKPTKDGKRKDVCLIQAASWENPFHELSDPVKRDHVRSTMDPRRFNMIFGGEMGRMIGMVYDCWDDDENLVTPFQLPMGTTYYAGVDWGYTDPFVMKVRAITPDGRHYGISEFYKTQMTLPDMIQIAKQKKQIYGIKKFFCDPSQPGSIEEFNRNGLPAEGADNDIRRGIDHHYELIKTRKYKEFRNTCPYTADEREAYHYPEPKDLKPDQDSKEQLPVGQNDHCLDADRYITISTYRRDSKLTPRIPGDEKKAKTRLDELKRSHLNNRTERWS